MTSTVRIYKTLTGRYAFVNVKTGRASNGHWASAAYAAKVARENGFEIQK